MNFLMQSWIDFQQRRSHEPVVFRSEFNHFQEITATQAWSLLLTASRDHELLGSGRSIGWALNWGMVFFLAIIVTKVAEI